MAIFRRVLDQVTELDALHPDSVTVQRAVAQMFKHAKRNRRKERNQLRVDADRKVLAATATGSPDRIDDETAGLPLTGAPGTSAGTLIRPQNCYICKKEYTRVDAFHHQLCPECAAGNRRKREQHADLTGRRALLTGGRAKIGMYIALMLLRDGAELTITTRFPRDAARRFARQVDADQWLHRLDIVGIDLRDPAQVVALADSVAARGPLDILVNNAAQTVRRSPGAYSSLADAELAPLTGSAASVPL
ncbi:SDR family NAD(P)-dependent oxidoreductase, partial [Williamsia sp.]|uniref:SDR family NAD(P)-dependent oxidoreductase n=1 Tax=Williamsia sp. TaxID=1872085 RepID=UPI002F958755